ncbi:serine hydrolase [Marinitenerispora sediminis]|uniref:Serine hydrolase n=1 Tax=Marinitenerispora sediminis TaxID=1931232 RepID=A0A368T507_9ACTN|nr:serine hydrolase [Marinitenerispora sediminis]RCV59684.1 serine hydrolase [Marinitenerispora sediminis]
MEPARPGPSQRGSRSRRGIGARITALVAAGLAAAAITGCGAPAAAGAPAPPIPAPAAAGDLTEADVNAWLDGFMPAALEDAGIAGGAVSVVHDGEVLTARGYGYSDTGTGDGEPRPVDPEETLFRVGSVSKLFTATAVMQLVESGDLDLDADVSEYLDFELPRRFEGDITLRHLLTHTAGFEERIGGLIGSEGGTVDLREAATADPPEQIFEPGTVPAYSNYGNMLAGYVVERVSGTRFEEYVRQNILDRTGMASSTFEQPLPEDLRERMSNGYAVDSDPAAPFETIGTPPAGSLTASATDMARFMQAQLGETGPEQALLDRETLALMHEPALTSDTLGTLADGQRMTLGFFDESRNGRRIIGHGGDTNYFHSHLQIYPEERTGIFVTLNGGGSAALDSLTLRSSLLSGFADRYFPSEGGQAQVESTAAEHAAMAEGRYESSRSMQSTFLSATRALNQTTVTARGDGTILISPGPETVHPTVYEEIAPWVWQEVGGQRIVTMRVAGGQVQEIGYASAFTLTRVDPVHDSAVVLPILLFSVSVLLVSLLSLPIGAIARRCLSAPAHRRPGRVARVLTRLCSLGAVLALAGWAGSIVMIMGLQDVPEAAIRVIQAAQWLGVAGVLPAAVSLVVDIHRRAGWARVLGSALVLAALVGTAWLAVLFNLLVPNVSY